MSTDPDTTRIVRSWLEEGVTALPDRVLDDVLDQVPATPQRRATWWPAWRLPLMNKIVTIGLGAAAVVVVLLLGTQLLGSPGLDAGDSTPSPEASVVEPTPEPSVAEPSSTFVLNDGSSGGPAITVILPAPGWIGDSRGILEKGVNGADPPDGAGMIGPYSGELYVYGDPCQWSTTLPATPATTVDEFVAALTAQESREASAPVDITVDGYAGKSITLHVPDDAVFADCDEGIFGSWAGGGEPTSNGPSRHSQGPGQIDEVWILDVNGELNVIDAAWFEGTPPEHVDDLHAILESMTFDVP